MTKKKWTKRPTAPYTQERADYIVQEVAFRSLTKICEEDENLPTRPSVYYWLDKHPDFRERYMAAVKTRNLSQMDMLMDLANEVTPQNANAKRVVADILKFTTVKLLPQLYGDHKFITQKNIGGDKEVDTVDVNDIKNMTSEVRDALRALTDASSKQKPMAAIEVREDIEDAVVVEDGEEDRDG